MKPILFLPPAIAAVAVTAWLVNSRGTITTLEAQSAVLRQHLAARSSGFIGDSTAGRPDAPAKSADVKKPINWKELAAQMEEIPNNGGMSDMRIMIRLQQRIQAMTRDELVAALDEIAALDLPGDSKDQLEQILFGPLSQKDPEFALNRYVDRLNDDRNGFGWQLSSAMQQWAAKDSAAATAWFDQQINAGKFDTKTLDGKNRVRLQFEGSVIGGLLATNPTAAAGRLEELPEDQRLEVLQHYAGNSVKKEDQLAFATLVRHELNKENQIETIANLAGRQAWGENFSKTDEFLDRVQATPAERAATVAKVTDFKVSRIMQKNKVTREDIDGLREWAATQSPDTVDQTTGRALANASLRGGKSLKFSEAADLALQYHQSSGNDDVIVSFFDRKIGDGNREEARALAEKISDPARRAAVLNNLN